MHTLKSWAALVRREFIEHRIPFLYFPLGILGLFALSTASGLAYNRFRLPTEFQVGAPLKLFEIGYIAIIALWIAYTAIALFFYFGDAFSADRRNNAMLFWKSMPLSDLKILSSKFLAGVTLFPLLIYVMAVTSGILILVWAQCCAVCLPGIQTA